MTSAPEKRPFHQDVDDLRDRVNRMAEVSRRMVHEGVEAFANLDVEAADRVGKLDDELNQMDVDIEKRALDLIALHQPMARDLRAIGASLKIITYLDRIGRYGYDIAEAVRPLQDKKHIRKLVSIPIMRDKALGLVDMAMTAYNERNADLAREVKPADDDVDLLYEQIFRECVTYMLEEPRNISPCTQYILVARHLERIGDNAGKIAEKTLYMVTGERRL